MNTYTVYACPCGKPLLITNSIEEARLFVEKQMNLSTFRWLKFDDGYYCGELINNTLNVRLKYCILSLLRTSDRFNDLFKINN